MERVIQRVVVGSTGFRTEAGGIQVIAPLPNIVVFDIGHKDVTVSTFLFRIIPTRHFRGVIVIVIHHFIGKLIAFDKVSLV